MTRTKRGRPDGSDYSDEDSSNISQPDPKRQKLQQKDLDPETIFVEEYRWKVYTLKEIFPSLSIERIYFLLTSVYNGDYDATVEYIQLLEAGYFEDAHQQTSSEDASHMHDPRFYDALPSTEVAGNMEGLQPAGGARPSRTPAIRTNPAKPRRSRKKKTTEMQEAAGGEPARLYDYMKKAPHRDHRLDNDINVTLVELLVLLGHAHLNYDVANRLLSNGLSYRLHQFIVRRHRSGGVLDPATASAAAILNEDEKLYSRNSILHSYQHAMRGGKDLQHPVTGWTFRTHKDKVQNPDWDPYNISLAGYKVRADTHRRSGQICYTPQPIPLESLLADVDQITQGFDAADLTRAVLYARDHPNTYNYPDDLELVVSVIGHTLVTVDHSDAACIARWTRRMEHFDKEINRLKRGAKINQLSSDGDAEQASTSSESGSIVVSKSL
jgi:hypothetical protein